MNSHIIAIHSVSDGPSIPARARNAASPAGSANRFHGQTSWKMSLLSGSKLQCGKHLHVRKAAFRDLVPASAL
jgi:hypothetical protein